ncbi:MAG TPA: MBL fold metallo-hydrolase [Gemmatimonadaceae bacterium]|nr:MBL fold metallo-hydrolase [Gemmatimonadaceae bacterium]
MIVVPFVLGPFQENCYVVTDSASGATAIVDPGSDGDRLVAEIEQMSQDVVAIWVTHAHVDHIGAIAAVKRRWNVPVYLHPLDQPLYRVGGRQAQLYGIPYEEPPPPDREFSEGEEVSLGATQVNVMHAPGHSPGHVVLHAEGHALVGDCLFAGSVGRTDLPFSNAAHLEASLARIAALPADTTIHPGHGDSSTIGEERISNPFLNGTARLVRTAST